MEMITIDDQYWSVLVIMCEKRTVSGFFFTDDEGQTKKTILFPIKYIQYRSNNSILMSLTRKF